MRTKILRIPVFLFLGCFLVTMLAISPAASAWFFNDQVKVMTQNLYLGADIFAVLEAAQNPDPALGGLDGPIAVAALFQTVQYTNFPERAEAIANEIWFHRPHLIGLQEVSTWYIQPEGDAAYGGTEPATTVVYDYLQILLQALAARGLHYEVAILSEDNADVELPMFTGFDGEIPTFADLRLVDSDVILVRSDVNFCNTANESYSDNFGVSISGKYLEFTRGWVSVDVEVCGEEYRFVNTHLEISDGDGSPFRYVQSEQMNELLNEVLNTETKPIILVGDFNSSPDDIPGNYDHPVYGLLPYVPPYMQAVDAGYLDTWYFIFFPRDGYTSGFDEYVSDPTAELTERIDLVLVRNKDIKWVIGTVVGDNIFNMTPSGLWPSDHGGVVTWITFK